MTSTAPPRGRRRAGAEAGPQADLGEVLARARQLLPHLDLLRGGSRLGVDDVAVELQADSRIDGTAWTVRMAREAAVALRWPDVAAVLARVAPALGGLFRLPVAAGTGWQAYPTPPGRPLRGEDLTARPVAGQLAAALALLHGLSPTTADPQEWRAEVTGLVELAVGELLAGMDGGAELGRRWQAAVADDTLWPGRLCAVHSRLTPEAVLTDGGRLTAVRGWECLRPGDPAADLAGLLAAFGPQALAPVVVGYGVARSYAPAAIGRLVRAATLLAELRPAAAAVAAWSRGEEAVAARALDALAALAAAGGPAI